MPDIRKVQKLPKLQYFETHLALVNCVLPLNNRMTPMEMKVVANFMSLEGDVAQYRLGPTAKKIVMESLQLSPAGLSNHITSLTKKGLLVKKADITNILPLLIPNDTEQLYMFKLINNGTI